MIKNCFNLNNFENISSQEDKSSQEPQNLPDHVNAQILDLPHLISRDNKPEQSKILMWLFNISQEDRVKVCSIHDKHLIKTLYQMYLVFKNEPEATFASTDFELYSLNSFNLLNYKNISSNDEIKSSKKKEEKEKNSMKEIEFLKNIKILSLNDDDLNCLAISGELLSDVQKFKFYFKLFTNDNYFEDRILPFEKEFGKKKLYLPDWMSKPNSKFTFCEIIIGFLEQNILRNYEFFCRKNKINEFFSYNEINELIGEINNNKNCLINIFDNLEQIIKQNKKNKKNKINNINKINEIYQINEIKNNENDNLRRIISRNSVSTLRSSNYQKEENDNDSVSVFSDTSNNSSQNYNTMNPYINPFNFNLLTINYYTQGILSYCSIVQNNLTILNYLKEKYLKESQGFIIENLQDKYDITFCHYGSHFTGLEIEASDIDMFILYNNKNNINDNKIFRDDLYNLIRNKKPLYCPYKLPDSAELPLVILYIDIYDEIKKSPLNNMLQYINFEEMTKLKIDVTYNSNSEMMKNYEKAVQYVKNEINKYPQIRPIILFLKRYVKNLGMNKFFKGGVSSYSLFLITLNAIKSYEKNMMPGTPLPSVGQLFIYVLQKFSYFDFRHYGIGSDGYDYKLEGDNYDDDLFILDPITGKNIAKVKCKGDKFRKIFGVAFQMISSEINLFQYNFNFGFNPFIQNPLNSINTLFHTNIKI